MPPLRTPAATTNGPTPQPRPLGLPGSRTPPDPLPPLRGPVTPTTRVDRGPRCTPPPPATGASLGHSSTPSGTTWEGTTWRTQRTTRGPQPWPRAAHPCAPHSPPLRHSGGGLNVAARHVLLALYLHHRDLHLQDPQLPARQAAAPTPEAWADTAPEEMAAYL